MNLLKLELRKHIFGGPHLAPRLDEDRARRVAGVVGGDLVDLGERHTVEKQACDVYGQNERLRITFPYKDALDEACRLKPTLQTCRFCN